MLINCVAYEEGRKLSDIPIEDIDQWLRRPGCFVWVALRDASDEELHTVQHEFGLHELAVEDASHGHQRPKIEEYGQTLFVVMKLPQVEHRETLWGELAVFVGPNFVVSVRNQNPHDFLGVRARCEREPEHLRQGAGFVLYALMDAVVDRYFPLLDALETELEAIEDTIFERGSAHQKIQRLYELKRHVAHMRHAVAPLSDAVGKLHGGRVPAPCAKLQEYFRDVQDHLTRINAAVEAMRETIGAAI